MSQDRTVLPAEFGATFKEFMDAVIAEARPSASPLLMRIREHLGADPVGLSVIAEEFDPFEHPNVQVAMDAYLEVAERRADLVGVAAEHKRYMSIGLSELVSRSGSHGPVLEEGPVDYVNFHLAGGRVLACVQYGLYFIHTQASAAPLLVFIAGPSDQAGPRMLLRIEVMSRDREAGQTFLSELMAHADRLNVYRGHVISLSPNQFGMGPQTLIAFHSLPLVTRDDVVLPDGLLERIERHTIVFGEHAERLRAQNRSLKRGLLLYGPPGTGKTWTVMYLAGRLRGRTVILASGRGMGMFQQVAQVARKLAPSMVVLEDVDLIAEDRGNPFRQPGPVLFELLNEMDGLRDDTDVIFVLTTNRPEVLEPALAARPGRVDLVVEFPMPDAHSRLRILQLYSSGVDIRDVDLESIAERTAGASPAYLKELLRKATLLAAADNSPHVTRAHFERASEELSEGGRLIQQVLGFQANPA